MIIPGSFYSRIPTRVRGLLDVNVGERFGPHDVVFPMSRGGGLLVSQLGAWKIQLFALLSELRSGTFVDVGVNLGQTLLEMRLAGLQDRFVGFEPNPSCVPYAERLAHANGITDFMIVPTGLAAESGVCRFYRRDGIGDESDAAASLIENLRPGRALKAFCVSVHPFDSVRDAAGIDRVGIIKIDVEGAESQVVAGMRGTLRTDRPIIVCEVLTTDRNASLAESDTRNANLLETLGDADYAVARIDKSPDESALLGFTPIESFPSRYWTPEEAHLCDYVFYPREDRDSVLSLAPTSSGG